MVSISLILIFLISYLSKFPIKVKDLAYNAYAASNTQYNGENLDGICLLFN